MIREAQPSDLAAAARLASRLWPEHAPADLEPEFSELIESDEAAVFLLFDDECRGKDNAASLAFHLHAGFEEANRLICFAKRL